MVSLKSLVLMIMIIMMVDMAKSEMHCVGGTKFSWKPDVNMTLWSLNQKFYLKDWLYFGYNKHMYNVLEVNKTSYENCIDQDFIKNVTKGGGRDVFQLTELKTYYFLSSGGYCWSGMKVAIDVEYVAPASQPVQPPTHESSSASPISGFNHSLMVLVLAFVCGLFFK